MQVGQGHGLWKTRTGMPLRRTERLKDRSKTLGGRFHSERTGQVRALRGWRLQEKRKQSDGLAIRISAVMIALISSFGEQSLLRHQHAPALQAATEMDSTSCIERTMTLTFGNLDFMTHVASIPLRTGMLTSISTTSGLCFSTAWIAASPSSASATTCRFGFVCQDAGRGSFDRVGCVSNDNPNRCTCHD